MDALIPLLLFVLVVVIVLWLIDQLPLPGNVKMIAKVIVALIALIKALGFMGVGTGFH